MIKYNLLCGSCSENFDSWFASSKEFEKLKKTKLINCNNCNSLKIEKSVMSPRVSSNLNLDKENHSSKIHEVKSKIKEFQKLKL